MRKSPIKHHVRAHKRCSRPVHDYERGHGSHPAKPRLGRRVQSSLSSFMVHIAYANQSPETFPINTSDHAEAIELAMMSRKSLTPPMRVECSKV